MLIVSSRATDKNNSKTTIKDKKLRECTRKLSNRKGCNGGQKNKKMTHRKQIAKQKMWI